MSEIDATHHHLDRLNRWYRQPFGMLLKAQVAEGLGRVLKPLPVQELLYLGVGGLEEALAGQKGERAIFFTDVASQHLLAPDENILPLKADSQDCIVLLHALDVAADAHMVLREVDRIMSDKGYLVIVGFNRWSAWGMYRPLRRLWRWNREMPWPLRFYGTGRLRDWLSVLGFGVQQSFTLNFRPLLQNTGMVHKLSPLDTVGRLALPFFGNVYILLAQKNNLPLTPVKLRWKFRSGLLDSPMAKPTCRQAAFNTIPESLMRQ